MTLRSHLNYEPQELKFGTSGRRGLVVDLTQLEIYINVLAELKYLQMLPESEGGINQGDEFYFARDLRPSSSEYVAAEQGRGEIAQAVVRAIVDAGMRPVNLGRLPTPALMSYAMARRRGSIMVTGSHIPFNRNGYKTNTAIGELLKVHEAPINMAVEVERASIYSETTTQSRFNNTGRFKRGHQELPAESDAGYRAYVRRYTEFFPADALAGMRLLVYQHSAVGRDLLVDVLNRLGAKVYPAGRSETFVPIDTENIDAEQLAAIQKLVDEGPAVHAVVSTDGDSDRPLLLGVDETRHVRFFGGDLLGMVVAQYLGADAVVVPVSCNDGIDRGPLAAVLEPKTRIGSPYVIAGMNQAREKGKKVVCGWEANGGFLLGSDITRDGRTLSALPTRDALLPLIAALAAANDEQVPLAALFDALPRRFSRASLMKQFPRERALAIVSRLSPPASVEEIARFFPAEEGFSAIDRIDYTDGVRISFTNGDVAHLRPSGNADEFRIYAVADAQERADEIARLGVAEPDGILRRLEREIAC